MSDRQREIETKKKEMKKCLTKKNEVKKTPQKKVRVFKFTYTNSSRFGF